MPFKDKGSCYDYGSEAYELWIRRGSSSRDILLPSIVRVLPHSGHCEATDCKRQWSFLVDVNVSGRFSIWGFSDQDGDADFHLEGLLAVAAK